MANDNNDSRKENLTQPIRDDRGDQGQTDSNSTVGSGGADAGVRLDPEGHLV